MTGRTIRQTLDAHGIQHKTINGVIYALSVGCLNGVVTEEWVLAPTHSVELLEWLGY